MWRSCGSTATNVVRKRALVRARGVVDNLRLNARLLSSRQGSGGQAGSSTGPSSPENTSKATTSSTAQRRRRQQPARPFNSGSRANLVTSVKTLLRQSAELGSLPPIWSKANNNVITSLLPVRDEARIKLFRDTRELLQGIKDAVRTGTLRPSDKHRHEVIVLLERVLQLYSESYADKDKDVSVFDECTVVLEMAKEWKLELQHKHVEYAILAAGRENRWKDAANLFWSHIDPEDCGYIPFNVDVSNPVGLYAIARFAQENGGAGAAVENVFDGVLRMSMVSPTDQRKYILAAGTALGRAGEWEAFVKYLKTSYNASQLGQPLVAALMHACLLCDRPTEALEIFDKFANGNLPAASEWQWAGGEDRLDPLCRDLAMQALGGSVESGLSERAWKLYQEAEQDAVTVSIAALDGVVGAFEKDENWEDAVTLLLSVINRPDSIVSGDNLETADLESASSSQSLHIHRDLGQVVNSVMRTCNTARQFGVALLCLRLFEISIPTESCTEFSNERVDRQSEMEQSLVPLLCGLDATDDCLASTIISLCGVNCPTEANALFQAIESIEAENADGGKTMFRSRGVNGFAVSGATRLQNQVIPEVWPVAWRHIHRITATLFRWRETGERVEPEHLELLSSSLATCLRCCTAASQAETGLYLARWVESVPTGNEQSSSDGMLGAIPLTDSLVAAVMEAYNATGSYSEALDLFEVQSGAARRGSHGVLSYNAALNALFSLGKQEEGIALFRQGLAIHRNPDMFCITAKALVDSKRWDVVADIYRLALSSGCLSEELSKLALVAVASDKRGTLRSLRSIIKEAANLTDTDPVLWLESKYWRLKRLLGFSTVRTLMWWDDANTAHLDELDFAFATLEMKATAGLSPNKDALRLIATAATSFRTDSVPPNRTGLPRVPRSRDGWIDSMARLLVEAKETTLLDDAEFVTNVAVALRRLDCDVECVTVVSEALARGVWVQPRALEEASVAARNAGLKGQTVENIQMLVTDVTSISDSQRQ